MTATIPVVELGVVERSTGFDLDVLCTVGALGEVAAVHALRYSMPVALLKWYIGGSDDEAEVLAVETRPDWRNLGVATMLWNAANTVAAANGWPSPRHSPHRTPCGDGWAKKVGGPLPDLGEQPTEECVHYYHSPTGEPPGPSW